GDYVRAEQLLQRALAIWTKFHGTWHERTSHAIANLGDLYRRKGDFARAEPLMRQALEIRQKVLSPSNMLIGLCQHGLGVLYLEMGDYARAEQSLQQAEVSLEHFPGFSVFEGFTTLLHTKIRLFLATGRNVEAIALMQRVAGISESQLSSTLAFGSEQDKLNFLAVFADETNQALSLNAHSAPNDAQALQLAFTTWLQRKGRALDEMNRSIGLLRRGAGNDAAPLTTSEPDEQNRDGDQARVKQLTEEIGQLEAAISARSAEFRAQVLPPVTLDDVRRALPPGSALVEFAQYQPEDARTKQKSPPRYLAYVLPKEGEVQWVELGEVAKIDAVVGLLRRAIGDKDSRTDPRPAARKLDELVMQPIRPRLGQARTVFLSPDGELNLTPFAALRDERGRYLIEDYLFIYLTSGRDLLRLQVKHESQPEKLIFAVSDFDGQNVATASATKPSPGVSDTRGGRLSASATMATLRFDRLAFARAEGEAVQRIFPQAKLYADGQALETALKQVRRPYFLHLVTHGFFLPDGDHKLENSLLRSGLAFAGANQRHSGDDDGLLTAFEAAALDLWGTKLVVLSACETGVGAVKNGEGVFGLRRALVLAGAETQVASLWRADDLATRKLMRNFYGKLNAGLGRAEALRQAQLEMLRGKANPQAYYWANFICIGEWKPLNQ
ncbi:MAG: CHAT domain-containing protein, partial [Acidobacteriota bacterium]|nr:CHAT domain-containing protein [Acidobacteriota bacterium]